MATRKTISIEAIIDQANLMLAESTCSPAERHMLQQYVFQLLNGVKAYNGVRYLKQNEVPNGHLPGITSPFAPIEERFKDTDNSRVSFLKPLI